MARLASIIKNDNRKKLGLKYFKYRKELREKVVDEKLSDEERAMAALKLQKLPRNTSICRARSRCALSGRPRGNYKKFGISRLAFRKLALEGKLPGVTKSSW